MMTKNSNRTLTSLIMMDLLIQKNHRRHLIFTNATTKRFIISCTMGLYSIQISNKVNNLFKIIIEHREKKYKLSLRNLTPKVIVGPDEGLYFLFLEDSENKESAILRSNEYQLLQSIKIAMVSFYHHNCLISLIRIEIFNNTFLK